MFERLENRCMFQVSAVPMTINGTGAGDTIILTQSGNSLVVKKNGVTTTHALSGVTPGATPTSGTPWVVSKVVINGLGGNDKIQAGPSVQKRLEIFGGPGTDTITGGAKADLLCGASSKTAAESGNDVINGGADNDEIYASMYGSCSINGQAGNDKITAYHGSDTITGGSGDDSVNSGAGNDIIRGGTGKDHLHGQEGNDAIWGDAGGDWLFGENGNDRLYGGADADFSFGGVGRDTLVSVGGGQYDNNYGQGGTDSFWVDSENSEYTDASAAELSNGWEHRVASFMSHRFEIGPAVSEFAVSREPSGQDFQDPIPHTTGYGKANFSHKPLFASGGPSEDDIFQGSIGDCYFMAPLSAIAQRSPDRIRKLVTELGDGTYAVHFRRDGKDVFVRVDGDLWTKSNGGIAYAKLGQGQSMWVPVVEKAWAYFRRMQGRYNSISGGNGSGKWNEAMHLPYVRKDVAETFDEGEEYLSYVQDQLDDGKAVILSGPADFENSAVEGIRRGQHVYMVNKVNSMNGSLVSIELRDPYGQYITISAQHLFNRSLGVGAITV